MRRCRRPDCRSPRPRRRRRRRAEQRRSRRVGERRWRRRSGCVPADLPAGLAGALGVEVGDGRDLPAASVGTCARNIEPNLPAPIRPTRDRPAGGRPFLGQARRFTTAPRGGHQLDQAVVGEGLDGGEVAMSDPLGPLEAADVVVDPAQREVDDHPPEGADVRRAGVHEAAVEHEHAAGGADGRHDAAPLGEAGDRGPVERPQRVGGGGEVVAGFVDALAVAAGDEQQRARWRR